MEAKRQDIGMDIDENKKEETQKKHQCGPRDFKAGYLHLPWRSGQHF